MTIAGFYLTPEGVVLGADSTMSSPTASGMHYFNFTQKILQIGEGGTLGLMVWGLASVSPSVSYRTLVAKLDDSLKQKKPKTVLEVAQRWVDFVWPLYDSFSLVARFKALKAKPPHNAADPASRTQDEEVEFKNLCDGLVLGFCIAGYIPGDRTPIACSMQFSPDGGKPSPTEHKVESFSWWGMPNIVKRLIFGADDNLKRAVVKSPHWKGTDADFDGLLAEQRLMHGSLPIRDAVDYVHSCIYSTIKAMKFSSFLQVCGGPIEVAVITTDRKFRWVRHKSWEAAILDGESHARPSSDPRYV
ncbi:hypothetical protein [Methylibium sp.]|uniref:hypothetical protein n=1 Tax=Methylibium sp. TaxID=2067992 RepID=UPI0033419072